MMEKTSIVKSEFAFHEIWIFFIYTEKLLRCLFLYHVFVFGVVVDLTIVVVDLQ